MTDGERAEILNKSAINLVEYDGKSEDLNAKNVSVLKSSYNSQAGKILKSLGEKFGVFKTYNNDNVSLDFEYSRGSLSESVHKQGNMSTDFYDFAKMLYVFDDVVKNAVPIEVHTDKYKGTIRENTNLKQDYVLLSAFKDGDYIVPVEFHLKEMNEKSGNNNKLYVSVTLGKIKMEDKVKVAISYTSDEVQTKDTRLSSSISIPKLISKINPDYGNFYKYLPASMLSEQQNNARNTSVADENYRLKVMRGEDVTDILSDSAAEKGYSKDESWKMDHKAPNSSDGYSNSMDSIDKSYGSDGSIYSQQAVYYYGEGRSYDNKAISVIKSARNNPEKMIKIYRAVPNSIRDTRVRNGDWVAIVKEYAVEHGERIFDDNYRIIENTVPAKQLFSNGDSINEWGYDNGNSNEVYKNTDNNVKVLGVTYDDNGNLIPLSKRFNDEKSDTRFSLSPTGRQATPTATNIPMRDMAYNGNNSENVKKIDTDLPYGAPVRDDIQKYQSDLPYGAPVRELTEAEKAKLLRKTGKEKKFASPDNLAPVREDIKKSKQIASGERSDQLLNESLDNYPMKTVEQKVNEKIRAVEAEIADNRDLRAESLSHYNEQKIINACENVKCFNPVNLAGFFY